jgi:D-cysteine desulfhydrase family pyridoxal phosphate-dependent enzyme
MTELNGIDRLCDALASQPRFLLASLPTPLEEAPNLSARLGVRVLVKRDDQTGLALGGNKVRKLEFLIADALAQQADTIVTTGGSQSNHARLTAAACRRAGLACHLVLDRGLHPETQGNLLLDHLLGAQVQLIDSSDPADATTEMHRVAHELRDQGRSPYIVPRGGSVPAGATGYAALLPELIAQLEATGQNATHLYLATGSTGTHSGTLAGATVSAAPFRVQGISVSRSTPEQEAKVLDLGNRTLSHLGLASTIRPDDVHVDDAYRGPGYGHVTEATMEAIEAVALDEGIFLDPVYTGKAMAGLIDHARTGLLNSGDTVVFLHTSGAPALFAYHQEVAAALGSESG